MFVASAVICMFCIQFIMATRKDDFLQSISVQLDGKNYSYRSYVIKNFLRGKSMWDYVLGDWDGE